MKSLIPNFFTMANLVCGCLAIFFAFKEPLLETATLFIMAGAFFDLFDGFFARLLKVQGEMGKQLDSLADAVTFGVAPGIIVFLLFSRICSLYEWPIWVGFFAFLLVIASIYRLAKFNIDKRQSDSFRGLPTPSNALFWIGIVYLYSMGKSVDGIDPSFVEVGLPYASYTDYILFTVRKGYLALVFHPATFIVMIVGMSWWMISDLKMLALKFKDFGLRGNRARYILILASISIGIISQIFLGSVFMSLPIVLLLYLLISIGYNLIHRNHEVQR